ncbi:MAG TPA: 3-oxoadipate enol-lactonase [Ktedonobacterales bacterium]|nr:3-oxoadipate enol-lactonase [Ktedonobacterales bacterium]
MPHVELPSGTFFYRYDGQHDAPLLVLSNSLGTGHSMWDKQLPVFARHFRVLRYDSRGHGASAAPAGPYTIEDLGQDVIHLYQALGISRAHYCGLSMGGMVGMWLAANAPERVDRLALCNTAARLGPPQLWGARIKAVRVGGMPAIVSAVLVRWFTASFMSRANGVIEHMRQVLANTSAEGYIACCAAIRDMDQRAILSRIRATTLVIAGTLDAASAPADGRFLANSIAGARYVELNAAHLTNIEAADAFTDTVVRFLTGDMEGD